MIIGSPMINNSGYIATTINSDEGLVKVSYYGANERGDVDLQFKDQPMANNYIFHHDNPTIVAHLDLAFGTKVRFTNPQNGRQITCTVQDRGPFVEDRKYDLSYAAAKYLDILEEGVVDLIAQIVD